MSQEPNALSRLGKAVAARFTPYPGWVMRRHRAIILAWIFLAVVGAFLASKLPLFTDFSFLLPDGQPSVVALRALTARKTSSAVIELGVASSSPETTKRFSADLAKALREKLPKELLAEVDDDDAELRDFVWSHRHVYAPLADLKTARDALKDRMAKAAGFDLGLDDDEPAVSEGDKKKLDELRGKLAELKAKFQHEPGYIGEGGKLRMLVLRLRFGDTEPEKGAETVKRLQQIVAEMDAKKRDPSLEVGWCGDPVSAAQEHDLILQDVVQSTVLCLVLVALVLMVYFRAFRAVMALTLALGLSCAVTFGLTKLWIGHLNTSTAFLGSVVAGNGINFGLIYLARYFEERRRRGADHAQATETALAQTVIPTLVAAAAAGSAYLSLTVTTFRGFSEFGIIAGSGMAFCWLGAYTALPALLTWLERRSPLVKLAAAPPISSRRPWVIAPTRANAAIGGAVLLVTCGLTAFGARALWGNPFEDNLHTLRSRSYATSQTGIWSARLDAAFGRDQSGGFYIGVDKTEDVHRVVKALRDVEARTPEKERMLGKIDALSEVMPGEPAEQAEKIEVLKEIRRFVKRIEPRLTPGSDEAKLLADLRPPDELAPVTFADLPSRAQQIFTENDGRKGLLLAVHPTPYVDNSSYKSLQRSVKALRAVELPEDLKKTTQISGADVIFIEMMEAVQKEGPRASLLSLGLVLLLLFLAFGPRGGMALTTLALFVGVFGMFGLMSLTGVRLNFLNYIAIPITIGIGVDYPFNIVARIRQEGWGASRGVVRTAVAVAVCSSTTMIGYAVLLVADTGAIQSFGKAAVLGELTTISAAVVVVPAILLIAAALRGRAPATPAGAGQ